MGKQMSRTFHHRRTKKQSPPGCGWGCIICDPGERERISRELHEEEDARRVREEIEAAVNDIDFDAIDEATIAFMRDEEREDAFAMSFYDNFYDDTLFSGDDGFDDLGDDFSFEMSEYDDEVGRWFV